MGSAKTQATNFQFVVADKLHPDIKCPRDGKVYMAGPNPVAGGVVGSNPTEGTKI
jgi:hypothetical protein